MKQGRLHVPGAWRSAPETEADRVRVRRQAAKRAGPAVPPDAGPAAGGTVAPPAGPARTGRTTRTPASPRCESGAGSRQKTVCHTAR
jgi:hypothetical protein